MLKLTKNAPLANAAVLSKHCHTRRGVFLVRCWILFQRQRTKCVGPYVFGERELHPVQALQQTNKSGCWNIHRKTYIWKTQFTFTSQNFVNFFMSSLEPKVYYITITGSTCEIPHISRFLGGIPSEVDKIKYLFSPYCIQWSPVELKVWIFQLVYDF